MPTYDYQCDSCDHTMEMFQRITDDPIKDCPACGKATLRRLFGTGAAIVFKGSGFYQTDYRSASYKSAAEKESKEASGKGDGKSAPDSTSGTTSTDSTKPAKKPDKSAD